MSREVRRPADEYTFAFNGLTEGDMTTKSISITQSISQRMMAGLVCLFIGSSMVFTIGLSQVSAVHNAAHDTRHAIGFPCH